MRTKVEGERSSGRPPRLYRVVIRIYFTVSTTITLLIGLTRTQEIEIAEIIADGQKLYQTRYNRERGLNY